MVRCSGFIGVVILLLSIYFVSTVGRLFWEMRVEVAAPPEIGPAVREPAAAARLQGNLQSGAGGRFVLRPVLTTGITELPNGLAEAREAMERVGEAITAEMEKKISMLAVLGTLGPMIGLLGTLKGMISSFGAIARSGGQLDAGAGGHRHLRGVVADVRGRGAVGAGDLFLRPVPQPRGLHRHVGDVEQRPVPAAFFPRRPGQGLGRRAGRPDPEHAAPRGRARRKRSRLAWQAGCRRT